MVHDLLSPPAADLETAMFSRLSRRPRYGHAIQQMLFAATRQLPARELHAPRGFPTVIHWHLSWQARILRNMPTRASMPGAIFGGRALREHVPSRHLIVDKVGAGFESAGPVCAFGAVWLVCRGLGAKEGPFSSGGRYRLEYFSHAPEWLYVKDLRTRAHWTFFPEHAHTQPTLACTP